MPLLYAGCRSFFAAFGSVVGERHFKTAARSLAAFAMLVNGYARQLGEQGLGHAANLRVVRRHSAQWATIAADEYRTVSFLKFSEATQLVEYFNRQLEPCVCAIRPRGMLFRQAATHRSQ